jgi:hypothetical protein
MGVTLEDFHEFVREISNPIEVLANLIYLTKHDANDPEKVRSYISMAHAALDDIKESTRQRIEI